jgi:epoxyqueuosine reductase
LKEPALADLLRLDDASFRKLFSGSPVKRIGRDRFIRNCLIAAGNSADHSLGHIVEKLKNDPSPIISEAAEWALQQLGDVVT